MKSAMAMRKASIKETGEEISQADWERFDAAVARAKAERAGAESSQAELDLVQERAAPAFERGPAREARGLAIPAPRRPATFR